MPTSRPHARRTLALGAAVGVAYLLTAQLGFRAAFFADQVTTVWAPTGIAQAALLLWGINLWPVIWLAAFAANALTNVSPWVASGIATGNTLEAVAAAWMLTRLRRFDPAFTRTRDAAWFVLIAVTLSPIISAAIGVTMLSLGGAAPWSQYGELLREWWLGDALGALLIAPAILTMARSERRERSRAAESAALLALTIVVTAAVSGQFLGPAIGDPPLAFVIFPFVILAAMRFGQPATALVTASAATVIVWNTISRYAPLGAAAVHENLLLVHIFMGVLGGSGLLLAAATTERRVLEKRRSAAYAASAALSGSSSLEQAAPRILEGICANLNWQAGGLSGSSIRRSTDSAAWRSGRSMTAPPSSRRPNK